MKFNVRQESLFDALRFATSVIERRQMRPILSSVLVDATGSSLRLRATDMEILLDTTIEGVTVFSEGSVALPGRKWQEVVAQMSSNDEITVESEENVAIVSSGRSKFRLVTMSAQDFPPQPAPGDSLAKLRIAREDFLYLLRTTAVTMAHTDIRHYFKTTLLELEPSHARTVSTNGMCLCVCTVPIKEEATVEFVAPGGEVDENAERSELPVQALIPRKAALELPNALSLDEEWVTVEVGRNTVAVECGPRRLRTNLVDSQYPRYQTVVPEANEKVLGFDRAGLVHALQAVLITANLNTPLVKFQVESDRQVSITSRNEVGDNGSYEIAADRNDQELDIELAFDGQQLVNVLNAFGSENVKLLVDGPLDSVLLTSDMEEGLRYVVSPLRGA